MLGAAETAGPGLTGAAAGGLNAAGAGAGLLGGGGLDAGALGADEAPQLSGIGSVEVLVWIWLPLGPQDVHVQTMPSSGEASVTVPKTPQISRAQDPVFVATMANLLFGR
jgi:hypothetical protein